MDDQLLARISRQCGHEDLVEALASGLPASDLHSLLLEVYRRRCAKLTPAAVLKAYKESRFTRPSRFDVRRLQQVEQLAWQLLPEDFALLELSPVAPLGTCSGLATVSQNKVLSTARNLEVVADPTNLLALESALRRQHQDLVQLACNHRVVRAQALPKGEHYSAHFRVLCLTSASLWSRSFEREALQVHWDFYARLLAQLLPGREIGLALTDLSEGKMLANLPPTQMNFRLDNQRVSGRGYYQKCCFKIYVGDMEVGDGGFTDWTQELRNNRREAFLSSCVAVERLAACLDAP